MLSCSIAVTRLIAPILERNGLPGSAASLVCGDVDVGKELVGSKDVDMGEPGAATRLLVQVTVSGVGLG